MNKPRHRQTLLPMDRNRVRKCGLSRVIAAAAVLALVWCVASAHPRSAMAESPHEVVDTAQVGEHKEDGAHSEGGHSDPFSFILIELAIIIFVAMLGRWLAGRFDQPAVLGELLIGVVLGNIGYWLGRPFFVLVMHLGDAGSLFEEVWRTGASVADAAGRVFSETQLAAGGVGAELLGIMTGPDGIQFILMAVSLWMFSSLGVILLLFMVGLESSVAEMIKVGGRASVVAVVGVVVPFGLGFAVSTWLLPDLSTPVHLFLGATLCATSVGITARVFKDLGALQRREARIILGAAVIDDVLGLIILAVVAGIVVTGEIQSMEIIRISVLSVLFLGTVMLFGERLARWGARIVASLDRDNNKLLFPLALAFAMSWFANQIELATIVGAFAAGLILCDQHFDEHSRGVTIEDLIAPFEKIFAPVFFVLMGMQVNLVSFLQPGIISLAIALTVAAIVGKLIAGMPAGAGVDRLTVGLGMVPRGEVGLIFASIGKGLGVVNDAVFSALVVMIMVSTLLTPPALKWSLSRRGAAA